MLKKLLISTILLTPMATIGAVNISARTPHDPDLLLSVDFEARNVVKVESGDFHFIPGQRAPVHTHPAPAIGYVTKDTIIQKVEGRDPIMLKEGEVFYEPAGPRITMFDNVSPTKEAIFIDVNLQQEGEPFIVFDKPPTENIDRRALPEENYKNGVVIDGAHIYRHILQPEARRYLDTSNPISGYVADGKIELRIKGKPTRVLNAGENFYQYKQDAGVVLVNAASDAPAKVIVFQLHKAP